jgi:hypothetical protein
VQLATAVRSPALEGDRSHSPNSSRLCGLPSSTQSGVCRRGKNVTGRCDEGARVEPSQRRAVVVFFVVAFAFLFVFFLVCLLSKEDIGSYQAIRRTRVGAVWMYSAHANMVRLVRLGNPLGDKGSQGRSETHSEMSAGVPTGGQSREQKQASPARVEKRI